MDMVDHQETSLNNKEEISSNLTNGMFQIIGLTLIKFMFQKLISTNNAKNVMELDL
jgi:hypothetical protein